MNILWISPAPNLTTGYGTVSRNVVKRLLDKGYNIKYLSLHQIGHPFDAKKFEFIDTTNILPIGESGNAADVLATYIKRFKIDLVITMIDIWEDIWNYLPGLLRKAGVKWIHHATVNTEPLSPTLRRNLTGADLIVAPSHFVEKQLLKASIKKTGIKYIPHGVDTSIYKPLSESMREIQRTNTGYPAKFVFGSVMVNKMFQKNWPDLFYAYKIFLRKTKAKDTILHCHTNPNSPGSNLGATLEMMGMLDNVMFTQGYNRDAGFVPEDMAKLYNVFNVNICATWGESFGLPVLESMACGIPQIMTDFSTCRELIKDPETGMAAKVKAMLSTPLICDQALVDPESIADCMIKLYKDKEFYRKCSENAVKFAQQYDWKNIIPMWEDAINSFKDEVIDKLQEDKD